MNLKTVNIKSELHRRLSIVAATKATPMRDEVNKAIENYVVKEERKLEKEVNI